MALLQMRCSPHTRIEKSTFYVNLFFSLFFFFLYLLYVRGRVLYLHTHTHVIVFEYNEY